MGTMEKSKKVFRSRIGVTFFLLVLPAFVWVFFYPYNENRVLYIVVGGSMLFLVLLITGMRVVISGNKLFLRIWFISNTGVNIADINSVERSYNPIASHAASFKRLSIHFKTGRMFWLISPVREKEFIEALKAINSDIRINIPEKKGKWRILDWDI